MKALRRGDTVEHDGATATVDGFVSDGTPVLVDARGNCFAPAADAWMVVRRVDWRVGDLVVVRAPHGDGHTIQRLRTPLPAAPDGCLRLSGVSYAIGALADMCVPAPDTRLARRLAKATPERLALLLQRDVMHRRWLLVDDYVRRVGGSLTPAYEVMKILWGVSDAATPGWGDVGSNLARIDQMLYAPNPIFQAHTEES